MKPGNEAKTHEDQVMKPVSVIGAGAWGTALADLLARQGTAVTLWVREEDAYEAIRGRGENSVFLPGHLLSARIRPTRSLKEAAAGARTLVLVVPSHAMRAVAGELAPMLGSGCVAVTAAKGIEAESGLTMAQVLSEILPPGVTVAALSGPSFAKEVAAGLPTAVTIACRDLDRARGLQALFAGNSFRVYSSQDVIGVELGGAVKNVIAIAAGISDGLGFGHNTRAALITRGLAEMARLAVKLGGSAATFSGLAGVGDLILTCTGDLSRNRTLGLGLGRGKKLSELTAGSRQVTEGVRTALSVHRLAEREGVDMPICEQVWRILYQDKDPRQAVAELMARDLKEEAAC
ncbi:MAG: NAD(P)H-dependent glycerol-3-phosphate dehydrogenase [Pseudomonadota bacterium]